MSREEPNEFEVMQNFLFIKEYNLVKESEISEDEYRAVLLRWGNEFGARGAKVDAIREGENLVLPSGKNW